MFSYLRGIITEIKANYVTLDVHDVGYQLYTPNPYIFELNQSATLYTYQKVAEDALTLYGFPSVEARDLFLKLISVNGIGPKSANAILAAGSVEAITTAIESGNSKFLQKFPGIGPKASQQIILDLKGKVDLSADMVITDHLKDVEEALVALGYSSKEIKKVLAKIDQSKSTQDMIKEALKFMLK